MSKDEDYEKDLEKRQLALVRWQQWAMERGEKVLVIFEGRDAAGKDGSIRVVTEHLSVRNTRVVALPKPWTGTRASGISSATSAGCPPPAKR